MTDNPVPTYLVSADEAADLLGVSKQWISKLTKADRLIPFRSAGRVTYYLRAEVLDIPPTRDCTEIRQWERDERQAALRRQRRNAQARWQTARATAKRQAQAAREEQRRVRKGLPDPAIVRQVRKLVRVRH